ncbi:NUDIX hydrolase [Massilia luteola]|uniref:NUDIX hydrolase n=1 Tax=Massilia luteola TaxID=3081751 RepID=UPI002ACC3184|nr:NUDIX hydrolase [Massilia sp. Gc5]
MNETWTWHPQPDDDGRKVRLHAPSCEANLDGLADPLAALTFVPGSVCDGMLGDVPLATCARSTVDDACRRAGAAPAFDEPPFALPADKHAAAGAVVREADGRLWLVAPSNAFGGYTATFPKGRVEPGLTLRATAIREVWEESGLHVELTAWLGDFARTQTFTRFYVARRIGGHPARMGWESQAVHLVTPEQARLLLNRETDRAVLAALLGEGNGPV